MKKLVSLLLVVLLAVSLAPFASAEGEPVELIWWMGTAADAPIDQAMVEEKLNEMSKEALGITVKCIYMTNEQIGLAMSSGEYFDMAFTCGWYNDFNTNAFDGMFLNIEGMVQEQTPALWASMPENLWQGAYVNKDGERQLLAVPVMKDYGIEVFWIIDTDYFVTEKGMEVPANMAFEDIEPYLAAYKADHPEDYPLKLAREGITSWSNFMDWIHSDAMISLDYSELGTANEAKVQLCFEMPTFVKRIEKIHDWYLKGYISPDAAVVQAVPRASGGVVQAGQGFYGADAIWSNARQKASKISRFDGPFLSTFSLQGALTAISKSSKHPTEALKLIEYANTNREYRNMLRYGIEGVHYTTNPDTTVKKTDAGVTNYTPWAYTQASYALSAVEASAFPSVPADPNMWQVVWDGYKDATTSKALGFVFDYNPVQNQVNACKAIKDMYWFEMQTGTSDPAVVFPQIIKELEDAGIRDVIAEAQRQLDEFLAAKK